MISCIEVMRLSILLGSVELRMIIRRASVLGLRWVRTPTYLLYLRVTARAQAY